MRGRWSTKHDALKGHQAVAGGNAPGRVPTRRSTLQGSQTRVRGVRHCGDNGFSSALSGSGAGEWEFPGALPPATI